MGGPCGRGALEVLAPEGMRRPENSQDQMGSLGALEQPPTLNLLPRCCNAACQEPRSPPISPPNSPPAHTTPHHPSTCRPQNFLALIPLALFLGEVTEDLAVRFGDTIGGLLNATFGNVVEL